MPAYVIGQITINDQEAWSKYRSQVPATLKPFGGELVLRGHEAHVFSGQHRHSDVVLIRFPDLEAATAWHDSEAYQALVPLRMRAADVDLICYQADG